MPAEENSAATPRFKQERNGLQMILTMDDGLTVTGFVWKEQLPMKMASSN